MGQRDGVLWRVVRAKRRACTASGVWVALWLLVLCFAASVACRGHDEQAGVGGQSGDEGRRPSTWLGTGGVAAEPRR